MIPIMMHKILNKKIEIVLLVFMIFLIISGITAFPLEQELRILLGFKAYFPSSITIWLQMVYDAIVVTNNQYPFISYGTDWLAFAHIVIAVVFIGPLRNPVRNIWVIQFGMIACIMILPLAIICGYMRQIPLFWQLIDCSFGLIGFVPLFICYKWTKQLELLTLNIQQHEKK